MTDLETLARTDVKIVDDDLATVLSATIADYETRTGKTLQPAHIERLLINTFAYRESLTRQQINEAYRQQHVRFATGLMLDLCGDDVNTPRLSAQAAQTTIRFTASDLSGTAQIGIPAGTRVAAGEVNFATEQSILLSATTPAANVVAICATAGAAGNGWTVGQISTLVDDLGTSVEVKATNTTVSAGGIDDETDDAYRTRISMAFESFSVAGPVGAYEYYTRQVSQSICDVNIDNPVDENDEPVGGKVVVTVLTQTGLPSPELLLQVQTALNREDVRPLCDTVYVAAPETIEYSVHATLTLLSGYEYNDVLSRAQASWNQYVAKYSLLLGQDIVPLEIAKTLKVDGVYNVELPDLQLTKVLKSQWARCVSMTLMLKDEPEDG